MIAILIAILFHFSRSKSNSEGALKKDLLKRLRILLIQQIFSRSIRTIVFYVKEAKFTLE